MRERKTYLVLVEFFVACSVLFRFVHKILKFDLLSDRKIYCSQACARILQPGNLTGWGSEGVSTSFSMWCRWGHQSCLVLLCNNVFRVCGTDVVISLVLSSVVLTSSFSSCLAFLFNASVNKCSSDDVISVVFACCLSVCLFYVCFALCDTDEVSSAVSFRYVVLRAVRPVLVVGLCGTGEVATLVSR